MRKSGPSTGQTSIWLPVAIFCCAALLRGVYLCESRHNDPTFYAPVVDSLSYDLMACDFAEGGGITRDFFWQQFFYPFFLSIVYLISNSSILFAKIIQMILGSIACVAAYYLGKRIFDSKVGLIAALGAAAYGPLIFFEAELLAAGWAAFWAVVLILIILKTAEEKSLFLCFTLGMCSALSILTRPNFILFLIAAVVWLMVVWIRRDSVGRQLIMRLAIISIGFCMVVVPVAVKNHRVTGRFSFLPGTSALNFYIGNNPDFEATSLRPGVDWTKVVELPLRKGFKTPQQRQRFYYSKTFDYVRSRPLTFLGNLATKAAQFTSSRELPGHIDIYLFRKWSHTLKLLVWKTKGFGFPFGILLPLALLGIALTWRKIPAPVWLFLILYSASVVITHVEARYRIPLIAPMCIFAAAGVVRVIEFVKLKQWLPITAAVFFCMALGVVSSLAGPFYSEEHVDYEIELHYVLAGSLADRGRVAGAEASYRRAISLKPDYLEAYQNLGLLLIKQRKLDKAIAHYEMTLPIFPEDAGLYEGLGIALLGKGKVDDAITNYQKAIEIDPGRASSYDNLGTAYLTLNRIPEAIENFQKAIDRNPYDSQTHTNMGSAFAMQGKMPEAIEYFETSLRLKPNRPAALCNLASAYAGMGQFEKATRKFEEALRIAPNDAETLFNLALCLQQQGRTAEAVRTLREALIIEPRLQKARRALDELSRPRR